MTEQGFPGAFQGGYTTGFLNIGAVGKLRTGSQGFPGAFQGGYTTGYLTIGAVQRQPDASGTSTITLGSVTISAAGVTTDNGTSAITLGSVTISASGVTTDNGTGTITLGDVTISASGVTTDNGTGTITLGDVTISASGTTTDSATSTITLAPVTISASGSVDVQIELAKQIDWILKLVLGDEVHDRVAGTVTKFESGTSTLLIRKTFAGSPFTDLVLTQSASGDDTYSGSTNLIVLLNKILQIRAILEADEAQTGSTLVKYTKATVTPILTKNVTGTPLIDLRAVQ